MFREMRRSKQQMSVEEMNAVMSTATSGILACHGDEGYPYAVPLSYVYLEDKIYFHCAKVGHKMDAILKNPKVSFAVVGEDTIVSAEYTSYFRSVIAFGHARLVEGDEWFMGFKALVEKYSKDQPEEEKLKEIHGCGHSLIVAIDVVQITGKKSKEYV